MGQFSFVNLENSEDPEEVLTDIINFSLNSALSTNPGQRLLVVISSTNLADDIGLTVQQINENTVETIKNRFLNINIM